MSSVFTDLQLKDKVENDDIPHADQSLACFACFALARAIFAGDSYK